MMSISGLAEIGALVGEPARTAMSLHVESVRVRQAGEHGDERSRSSAKHKPGLQRATDSAISATSGR